jgi:hypothetical protein
MRRPASLRRILLAATWLAGTVLATGIVYQAVNAVADQVAERREQPISQVGVGERTPAPSAPAFSPTPTPGGPSPSPTSQPTAPTGGPSAPTATPPATSTTRTFALVGGTASVSCTGSLISLNWATPNSGFQVETGSSGGGSVIEVKFRSDTHESRVEAWCGGGQVQGNVREENS